MGCFPCCALLGEFVELNARWKAIEKNKRITPIKEKA
jgi:hypothetical protein